MTIVKTGIGLSKCQHWNRADSFDDLNFIDYEAFYHTIGRNKCTEETSMHQK